MRAPAPTPSPDVVVIGGGIVGVSVAVHLAETGRRVVLLERASIGAGASGRNSGVVQHPFDPVLVRLHLETLELYRTLSLASAGAFHLPEVPSGLLQVTPDAAMARRLTGELVRTHPALAPTYLEPGEARRIEPGLAPDIAACRLEIGYPVGPMRATLVYAEHARALGVDLRTGTRAVPWIEAGRVRGVRLEDGRSIAAETVVVAAGPWSAALIDPSGAWRPIRPLWGVVVTVVLEDPPRHVLEEAEIDIEPAGDEAPPDTAADGRAFSLVTADGASSLGSTFLDDEPDPAALVASIVERGGRFVPAIATASVGAHRLCARPLSLDGRPLVGRVPGIDGLWLAAGHGPWGISTGPASGRLLADLVDGRVPATPAELDPARFGAACG
jgi:glycine/D-amino acid oxidase-like deaminating enzyme